MKKKLPIILSVLLAAVMIFCVSAVAFDANDYDYSYDSGGSDWGSSSDDHDWGGGSTYYYDDSDGGSGGGGFGTLAVVVIIIIIVVMQYPARARTAETAVLQHR